MFANSREVSSSQAGVHPRLAEITARHLREMYRRPVPAAAQLRFAELAERLLDDPRPRVLDAGCGTGASSVELARLHPHALVIGVDKSAQRLETGLRLLAAPAAPENVLLLRCDLVDFWQSAANAGWCFARQYLLYPNPWPKPEHVMRRWSGHPVLPAILACAGSIELRSNWRIYAQEFAATLIQAGWTSRLQGLDLVGQDQPLTPFECKYIASGHGLWRVDATPADADASNQGVQVSAKTCQI